MYIEYMNLYMIRPGTLTPNRRILTFADWRFVLLQMEAPLGDDGFPCCPLPHEACHPKPTEPSPDGDPGQRPQTAAPCSDTGQRPHAVTPDSGPMQ